jgi:5-methylthioadenosine/S-adenosylhomocysteine deaminase
MFIETMLNDAIHPSISQLAMSQFPRLLFFTALVALAGTVWLSAQSGPRTVGLVITNGAVVTMDGGGRVITPGAVAIDGTDIVAVDTAAAVRQRYRGRETIDAAGAIVLPGLVNTHTHAPMVLYRGLADDLALMEWLEKYIFPAEARTVSPEFVRIGTRLAALEMIQSGTTTFADMYYFEEEIAKATKAAGLRGVLGQTIIQFPVADARTPREGLTRAAAFIAAWKNDPLITPAVAPHALYTLDPATLKEARALAVQHRVPMLIHLAETQAESQTAKERGAASAVAYLDGLGVLGPGVLGAHGIWVSPQDIATLKTRGAAVAHNPASNMKLASGTAPVPAYLAAGVPVGLGTDGAASSNDLDMFGAMRLAALLHKLQSNDPRVVSAREALAMATIGGATSLGLERQIGSLEPGKRADVIIVSGRPARLTPMYDPVSHLVYAAHGSDVETTIVNGRVLMRGRKVLSLNEGAVLAEARAMAENVRAAVR